MDCVNLIIATILWEVFLFSLHFIENVNNHEFTVGVKSCKGNIAPAMPLFFPSNLSYCLRLICVGARSKYAT